MECARGWKNDIGVFGHPMHRIPGLDEISPWDRCFGQGCERRKSARRNTDSPRPEPLAPCKHCGHVPGLGEIVVSNSKSYFHYFCLELARQHQCWRGPLCATKPEARAAWNAVMKSEK